MTVRSGGDRDVGKPLMDLFTTTDIIVIVAIGLALIGGMIGLEIAERRARRRSRAAWHSYLHEGGLVRHLMARWKRVPKLTDRSDRA